VLVQEHALSVVLVETVSFVAHSAALKASECILTVLSGTLPRVSFAVDSRRIFSLRVQSIHVSVAVVGRTVPRALCWVGQTVSKSWPGSVPECESQCPRSISVGIDAQID
jgi:hypothetical protein